ncbi:MAG TPA: SCO family protein [Burkholderiales bacterium]|nr:SCO family protein [Burkholderiales bacterium]
MTTVQQRSRRALIRAAALAPLAVAPLSACSRRSFHGLDVTGVDWGRDFHLRDPSGRERTLADFRGKVVLLFFGFTQCPDICPTALARAAEVLRLLDDDGSRLQVIFVTIDPERDTPALLRAYTQAFHPSFLGLYGTPQETAAAASEFKVVYMKVPSGGTYTMDHTTLSYVFDLSGRLRLAVEHAASAHEVADDVGTLLQA